MSIKSLTTDIQRLKQTIRGKMKTLKSLYKGNALTVTNPITGIKEDVRISGLNTIDVEMAVDAFADLKDKYAELLKKIEKAELVTVRWRGESPQPTGGGVKKFWRLGYSKSVPGAGSTWHCVVEEIEISPDSSDPTKTSFERVKHFYLDQGVSLPVRETLIPYFSSDDHRTVWFHRRVISVTPNINQLYIWTYDDSLVTDNNDFPAPVQSTLQVIDLMPNLTMDTAQVGQTVLKPFTPLVDMTKVDSSVPATINWKYESTDSGDKVTIASSGPPPQSSTDVVFDTTVSFGNVKAPTTAAYLSVGVVQYLLANQSYDATYSTFSAVGSGIYLVWDIMYDSGTDGAKQTLHIDENGYKATGTNDSGDSYTYDYNWGDSVANWAGSWYATSSLTQIVNEDVALQLVSLPYPVGGTPSHTLSGHTFDVPDSIKDPGTSVQYFCSFAPEKFGIPPPFSGDLFHEEYDSLFTWYWPIMFGPTSFARVSTLIGTAVESNFNATYGETAGTKTWTVNMTVAYSKSFIGESEVRGAVSLLPMISVISSLTTQQAIITGRPDGLFMYHMDYGFLQNHDGFGWLTGSCKTAEQSYESAIAGQPIIQTSEMFVTRGVDGAVLLNGFGELWTNAATMSPTTLFVFARKTPSDTDLTILRVTNASFSANAVVDQDGLNIPILGAYGKVPIKVFQNHAVGLFGANTSIVPPGSSHVTPYVGIVLNGAFSGELQLQIDKVSPHMPDEFGSVTFLFRWFTDISDA